LDYADATAFLAEFEQLINVPAQGRDAFRIRRGDNNANNLAQKPRSCLMEDALPAVAQIATPALRERQSFQNGAKIPHLVQSDQKKSRAPGPGSVI
jgi:hypothetical protein